MWNIGNGFVENNICLGFYHVHPILATGIFTHPRPNPAALRQSGQRIYLVLRRETPVCRKWESSLVSGFNPSQNLSEFSGESSAIRMEKKRNIWNHHIWSGPPWIKKHGFPGTLQWGAGISFPVVPKPPCSASGKKVGVFILYHVFHVCLVDTFTHRLKIMCHCRNHPSFLVFFRIFDALIDPNQVGAWQLLSTCITLALLPGGKLILAHCKIWARARNIIIVDWLLPAHPMGGWPSDRTSQVDLGTNKSYFLIFPQVSSGCISNRETNIDIGNTLIAPHKISIRTEL